MDIPLHMLPANSRAAKHAYNRHVVMADPGITPAHLIESDFWVHLAAKFRVNDVIEILAPDYEMDLRVVAIDSRNLWARVRPIRFCGPDGVAIQEFDSPVAGADMSDEVFDDGYQIKFHGRAKFSIEDRFGNAVEELIATKKIALEKLAEIRREKLAA